MNPSLFLVAIPVLVALSALSRVILKPKIWLTKALLAASLIAGLFLLITVPQPNTVSATFTSGLQNVSFGLAADFLKVTVVCLVLVAMLALVNQRGEEGGAIYLNASASVLAILSGTTTTLLVALCVVLLGRMLASGTSQLSLLLSAAVAAIWFGTTVSVLNVAKTTSFAEVVPQELSSAVAFFWSLVAALWVLSMLGEKSRWSTLFAVGGATALVDNLNGIGLSTQNNAPVVLVGAAGCLFALWGLRGSYLGIVVAGFMVVLEEVSVAGADAADGLGLAAVVLLAMASLATNDKWVPWRIGAYSCSMLALAVSFATSYSFAATGQERFWLLPLLGLSGVVLGVLAADGLRRFLALSHGEAIFWKGLLTGAAGIAVACWAIRLVPNGRLNSFDFLSVNTVGDGFAFGYLTLGLLVLSALSWAVLVLAQVKVEPESLAADMDEVHALALDAVVTKWSGRGARLLSHFDQFLVGQPRLATVVLALLAYLVVVR